MVLPLEETLGLPSLCDERAQSHAKSFTVILRGKERENDEFGAKIPGNSQLSELVLVPTLRPRRLVMTNECDFFAY